MWDKAGSPVFLIQGSILSKDYQGFTIKEEGSLSLSSEKQVLRLDSSMCSITWAPVKKYVWILWVRGRSVVLKNSQLLLLLLLLLAP